IDCHPSVENVEGTLPQPRITELLPVAGNAAIELVHLVEAKVQHQARQHFTADAAGAVGDDRLAFEVVVGTAVELGDEVTGVADRRYHGIRESSDLGLEGVAPVEGSDVFSGDPLVQLLGGQSGAAPN